MNRAAIDRRRRSDFHDVYEVDIDIGGTTGRNS
jgi:hypothetical protein